VPPLTQLVTQENTEGYTGSGLECPTSSERVGVCIALHLRVLVVGGYKLVAREGYVSGLDLGCEWRKAQCPESPFSM